MDKSTFRYDLSNVFRLAIGVGAALGILALMVIVFAVVVFGGLL